MMVPPAAVLNLGITDDAVVDLFIATFAPRTDLYVANGSAVVREPITRDVIRKAIRHHYPISAYMAYCDEGVMRTHVSGIDFDSDQGLAEAERVADTLSGQGVPSILFESRRGGHLWMTWCGDMNEGKSPKAALVQRAMRQAISLSGLDPNDPKIEVFPKRGEDLAVGALRMPGLPHHKTHVTYPGYTTNGQKVETIEDILLAFDVVPYATLQKLAGPEPQAKTYPKRQNPADSFYFLRPSHHEDAPSASDVLIRLGIMNARPGRTVRCPAHQDRHGSLTIFKDDERVYCGAPACPLNGDGHGVGSIALAAMNLP